MIKSGCNNTSKYGSWNVLETVMSHLKWETRNCKGSHTIITAKVGSIRDLISQKKPNMLRQTIDCKTDTTWKIKKRCAVVTRVSGSKWVQSKDLIYYMASSVSGQDEPKPALWLAPERARWTSRSFGSVSVHKHPKKRSWPISSHLDLAFGQ